MDSHQLGPRLVESQQREYQGLLPQFEESWGILTCILNGLGGKVVPQYCGCNERMHEFARTSSLYESIS